MNENRSIINMIKELYVKKSLNFPYFIIINNMMFLCRDRYRGIYYFNNLNVNSI